jgi:hypothetical protein
MVEEADFSKIERGIGLEGLKITEIDIEERVLVMIGNGEGELQPPYDTPWHEARAQQILRYFEEFIGLKIDTPVSYSRDAHLFMVAQFPEKKVFEVIGSYASWCVVDGVEMILSEGQHAYLQSKNLLFWKQLNDFRLGQLVMRGILPDFWSEKKEVVEQFYSNNRCRVIGREQFLFYNYGGPYPGYHPFAYMDRPELYPQDKLYLPQT